MEEIGVLEENRRPVASHWQAKVYNENWQFQEKINKLIWLDNAHAASSFFWLGLRASLSDILGQII